MSSPAPPVNRLASVFPVIVSLRDPPPTFSIVVPDENANDKAEFTTCDDRDRSMLMLRVVVPLKSSVSVPPRESMIVSLPSAPSVSKT